MHTKLFEFSNSSVWSLIWSCFPIKNKPTFSNKMLHSLKTQHSSLKNGGWLPFLLKAWKRTSFRCFWSFWFQGAEVLSCSWRNFCTTRSVFSPSNTTKFAPSGLRTLGLEEEKCWVWCNKPILRAGLVTPIVCHIRFFLDQQKSAGQCFFGAKKRNPSIHLPMNQLWRRLTLVKTCRQGGQPKNQPLGMFPFFRDFPGELVGGVGCLFDFFSETFWGVPVGHSSICDFSTNVGPTVGDVVWLLKGTK